MKRKWLAICGGVFAVLLIVGVSSLLYFGKEPKINYIHQDSAINLDDPYILVGSKDYVFVCQVLEVYDYVREKESRNFPESIQDGTDCYTECQIRILENIKGNLPLNQPLTCYKPGGYISKWKNLVSLYEYDIPVEKGGYYIFTGLALEDGTLVCGGYNGTAALESNATADTLSESNVVAAYRQYVDNEVISTFEVAHYRAAMDPGYQNGAYNRKEKQRYLAARQEPEKLPSSEELLYAKLSEIAAENAKNGVTNPPDALPTEAP